MSDHVPTLAKVELKQKRQRANWSKLLLRPICLPDGLVLHTLRDAAVRVLELPPTPSSELAAERVMEAALGEGDMVATEIAVRIAIGKSKLRPSEVDQLKSLYASLRQPAPRCK
jgi:hypothetical protein